MSEGWNRRNSPIEPGTVAIMESPTLCCGARAGHDGQGWERDGEKNE